MGPWPGRVVLKHWLAERRGQGVLPIDVESMVSNFASSQGDVSRKYGFYLSCTKYGDSRRKSLGAEVSSAPLSTVIIYSMNAD